MSSAGSAASIAIGPSVQGPHDTNHRSLRLIVADDHPLVRLGLRIAIEKTGICQVVAEASTPDELLEGLSKTQCDALITDYAMPGGGSADGQTMLSFIHGRYPELPIILVTTLRNTASLRTAMKNGVRAIVEKSCATSEVPNAICKVMAGEIYITQPLRDRLHALCPSMDSALDRLSAREREVVRLYAAGVRITDIAIRLDRCVSTISRQRSSAMKKLGVQRSSELCALADDLGLTPQSDEIATHPTSRRSPDAASASGNHLDVS